MIKFWITEPIYGTDTLLLGNCSHQEVVDYLKKEWRWDIDYQETANGQLITIKRARTISRIVWVRNMEQTPYSIGVAVHELFHLTVRICYRIGIPIRDNFQETGENADEAAAYLLEFFTEKYLDELNKIIENKKVAKRLKQHANKRRTKSKN